MKTGNSELQASPEEGMEKKTDNPVVPKGYPTAGEVIDMYLSGKPITHTVSIAGGKIVATLMYPMDANAEEALDRMLIAETKAEVAKSKERINATAGASLDREVENLANYMMETTGIVNRNLLIGFYVVEYKGREQLSYPQNSDFYSDSSVKDRQEQLKKAMNPAIKATIIEKILSFATYVTECFKADELKNF